MPLSPTETSDFAGIEWYDSGIGFAIPAQTLMDLLPRLKQGKNLMPGVVGVNIPVQNLFTGEPLLSAVRPRSPAQKAGLKPGDRVVEVDGQKIALAAQFKQELARHYAGDTLRLTVLRDDKPVEAQLELVAKMEPYEHPFLGILPMRVAAAGPQRLAVGKPPVGLPGRGRGAPAGAEGRKGGERRRRGRRAPAPRRARRRTRRAGLRSAMSIPTARRPAVASSGAM